MSDSVHTQGRLAKLLPDSPKTLWYGGQFRSNLGSSSPFTLEMLIYTDIATSCKTLAIWVTWLRTEPWSLFKLVGMYMATCPVLTIMTGKLERSILSPPGQHAPIL